MTIVDYVELTDYELNEPFMTADGSIFIEVHRHEQSWDYYYVNLANQVAYKLDDLEYDCEFFTEYGEHGVAILKDVNLSQVMM